METDKTTLNDLSIFNTTDEFSVFSKINLCLTTNGSEKLLANFNQPLNSIEKITGIQQTIRFILNRSNQWPTQISNGTLLMIEKFYITSIDEIPANPSAFTANAYKLFHAPDYSLVKYSVQHCFDFLKGMQLLIGQYQTTETPEPLNILLVKAKQILDQEQLSFMAKFKHASELHLQQQLKLGHFLRYRYKQSMLQLMDIYAQLDAWYGMAMAVKQYNLVFPEFISGDAPLLHARNLYHLLLNDPVSYEVNLQPQNNFLFLTGANMAGKSTFIKSVGAAVFLAHIGMGVPAEEMKISFFDGLLSNINIADNLHKGESYFYNEVQRIKSTVTKISDGKKWLILIDELFKGTNVEDAMKCSSVVIKGLVKIKNSVFILSTHLYEIAGDLKQYPNIKFSYFETAVKNEQLHFNYQLRDGVSNDRLGYLILKNEGVVKLLENL